MKLDHAKTRVMKLDNASSTLLLKEGLENDTLAVWGAIVTSTAVAIYYGNQAIH